MDKNASIVSLVDEIRNRFAKIIRDLVEVFASLSRFFNSLTNSMSGIFEAMRSTLFLNRINLLRYQLPSGISERVERRLLPSRRAQVSQITPFSLPLLLQLNINSKIASNLSKVLAAELPAIQSSIIEQEGEVVSEVAAALPEAQRQPSPLAEVALGKQPTLKFPETKKTVPKIPLLATPISMAYMASGVSTPATVQFDAQTIEAIAYARQLPQLAVSSPRWTIPVRDKFSMAAMAVSPSSKELAVQSPIMPIIGTVLSLQMYSHLISGVSSTLPQAGQILSQSSSAVSPQAPVPSSRGLTTPVKMDYNLPGIPEGFMSYMPWFSTISSLTPSLSTISSSGLPLSHYVSTAMTTSFQTILQGLPFGEAARKTAMKALPTSFKGANLSQISLQNLILASAIGRDTFSKWVAGTIAGRGGPVSDLLKELLPSEAQIQIPSEQPIGLSIPTRIPALIGLPLIAGRMGMVTPIIGSAMASVLSKHLGVPPISDLKGIPRLISAAVVEYGKMIASSTGVTFGESLLKLGVPTITERVQEFPSLPQIEEQRLRMMPLEEPKVSGGIMPTTVNVEVSAGSENELRELERKISKILEEQMRRYYGLG